MPGHCIIPPRERAGSALPWGMRMPMKAAAKAAGGLTVRRYGRSYHLRIETAADLERVLDLDEGHWVATTASTSTMNCDATFLKFLEGDHGGRISCRDVAGAIRWLFAVLRDRSGVTARSQSLRLDAIDTEIGEGLRIRNAARKVLDRLGKADTEQVTLEQIRGIKVQVETMPVSEAGVVLPAAAEDDQIRQFIADVVAATGGAPHPSGARGVGTQQLDLFLAGARAYVDWHEQGQIPSGQDTTAVMPLGTGTPAAYEVLESVRGKIDQYLAQCEAAALDERFVQRMGWTEQELQEMDFDDPAVIEEVLANAPLAKAKPERELSFDDRINPHYASRLEQFRRDVVTPVLGESPPALSAGQWRRIKSFFAAHRAWVAARSDSPVASLPVEGLRKYLDERFAAAVRTLIAESTSTAIVLDNIRLTEKLVLYQAFMLDLVNNFVSFPHLYDPKSRAMFEMGTLVMDGRRFNLAVRADNRAQHAQVAKTSNMYLLYVAITPTDGRPAYELAVPVTSGGKGNLCVGKRGVFHDIAGDEFDARVTYVVDNPISIREAMVSPFVRIGRLFTGKVAALTATAEKKLDAQVAAGMSQATAPGTTATPTQGTATGGMLMGAGVALAALASAFAYIAKTMAAAGPLVIVISIGAALLLVMLPACILAFLKLRKRDLSAILEGSGWGINARMRLTRKQARAFTERPKYPRGTAGLRRPPWRLLLAGLVLAAIVATAYVLTRRPQPPQPPASQPAAAKSA